MSLPDHAERNRTAWAKMAGGYAEPGRRAWAKHDIDWGIWSVAEADVQALAGIELAGARTIELGCGTAYVSAWLARRGALPTGIDVTPAQLATARALQQEFGIEFPLLEGNAESTGLPDGAFDLAISEYGASIWCDPERWIPEAARLLVPGGWLVFLRNSHLSLVCMPKEGSVRTTLERPYASTRRIEWDDDHTVEFQAPPSEMIRILRAAGFEIEGLIDLYPPAGATETRFPYMTLDWARRWPSEEIWRARKRA